MSKPRLQHIVEGRTYCGGTERYEVYAFCGVSQEASGSGRHTLEVGDVPCQVCKRIARDYYRDELTEY